MNPIEQISEAININEHYIEKWILAYEMKRETNIYSYEWALCIIKNITTAWTKRVYQVLVIP